MVCCAGTHTHTQAESLGTFELTATYRKREELLEDFWTIMCSAFDRDGNGVLDREEFAELVSVINHKCDPIDTPACLDSTTAYTHLPRSLPIIFRQEASSALRRADLKVDELFAKADTDKDNTLTLPEVLASCANTDIVPCQVRERHTPHACVSL